MLPDVSRGPGIVVSTAALPSENANQVCILSRRWPNPVARQYAWYPEAMLNPQRLEARLPDLARELGGHNYGKRWLRRFMALTPEKASVILAITGNFAWLPTLLHPRWLRWQAEHTLEIDCFVHWAGQVCTPAAPTAATEA